jgi:WD40 repeat protein
MLDKTVGAIALSADGRLLAGASQNEPFITLWDTTTLTQVRVLNAGLGPDSGQPWMPGARPRHVWDVDFSPEGKLLAAAVDADTETQLMLWDVASGGLRQTIPIGDGYASLAFAPDGASLLIWRNAEGGLGVWDVGSGSLRFALDLEVSYDTQVAFSADGRLLALVSGNLARLVDMASGEELATFRGGAAEGLGAQLKAVALSPDGRWLAAGTEGGELLLWEVEAGEERLRLVGHRGGVESLAFSDDGGTLASSAYDGTVLLWDLDALLP